MLKSLRQIVNYKSTFRVSTSV